MELSSLIQRGHGIFDCMKSADEEITAFKNRVPAYSKQLDKAFAILCPSIPLRNKHDELYRFHCRELLDRVISKEDTRIGTRAEVLAALSDTSLNAPLTRAGQTTYEHLFAQLYGTERMKQMGLDGAMAKEFHAGQINDDIAAAQRMLTVKHRVCG